MSEDLKTKKPSILSFSFGYGEEKEYFIENLAMLLASGMDIIESLEAIKAEVKSTKLLNIINQLVEDISAGFSLSVALTKVEILPPHIIALIKIGEESGRLHESLKVVVTQQSKERSFKSKIRAAMMYPVFVMAVAMVVGIGIAWFILPRLSTVFSQLNLKLPLVTRLLMSFGAFLSKYGAVVVPSFIVGLILVVFFLFIYSKTKFIGQWLLFLIPGIKNLIREAELARFGYIMGTLLQSGLPVLEALSSLQDSGTLRSYGKIYQYLHAQIEEGKSFEESFKANKKIRVYIPTPIQSLISAGERSGSLARIFLNISETFEAKTELTTKNLSVILEPLLLVIVWLGVVAVALAVILPIYSLVGGLSNKTQGDSSSAPRSASPAVINQSSKIISVPVNNVGAVTTSSVIIIGPKSASTSTPSSTAAINAAMATLSAVQPLAPDMLEVVTNTLGYLNIRVASSSKSDLIRKALVGEQFRFVERQDGWYKIILGLDQFGWVSATYVRTASTNAVVGP